MQHKHLLQLEQLYFINPGMNRTLKNGSLSGGSLKRETLTKDGRLGLQLLEDLTALAAGGSVCTYFKLLVCKLR